MCRKALRKCQKDRVSTDNSFRDRLYEIIYTVKITMRKNIMALGDLIEYLAGIICLIKDNDLSSRIKIEQKDMEICMNVCSYMST